MQRTSLVFILLSLLMLGSCGRGVFAPGSSSQDLHQHHGGVTLAQMLSELDALPTPAADQFQRLVRKRLGELYRNPETSCPTQ